MILYISMILIYIDYYYRYILIMNNIVYEYDIIYIYTYDDIYIN